MVHTPEFPILLQVISWQCKYLVNHVGLNRFVEQSERLTTYLIEGLKEVLGDKFEMITPEDPKHRGATIAFKIKDVNVEELEQYLREKHQIEVDTRPPVMRIMAHALYNTHEDIAKLLEGISEFLSD